MLCGVVKAHLVGLNEPSVARTIDRSIDFKTNIVNR